MDINKWINHYRSMYIYGKTNTGKTTTILNILKNEKYDYSYNCLQKIKNEKDFLELLINQNILNMFTKKKHDYKLIVIDNIDYLNNCDKKILNIIIKFLKNKNNIKKFNHIKYIFIGINNNDKKVLELKNVVEFNYEVKDLNNIDYDKNIKEIVKKFLQKEIFNYNIINEKTIISLCYHENIIYYINNNLKLYEDFLKHFCEGDYYDRISFQKQLWQFNEMTFYLKVLISYLNIEQDNYKDKDIIFTKILTKYSNEYSNLNFITNICNKINCQKEELYNVYSDINNNDVLYKKIKDNITSLEEKRIIKLIL